MHRAFLTRSPTPAELKNLSRYLATYRDGTGGYREDDGSSRADPRQIERCFAELLHGRTTENKSFYDFVVEFNEDGGIAVRGASIKSKELKDLPKYAAVGGALRAHLEISNSSAKDWALCQEHGLTEDDFRERRHAERFGEVILLRQKAERQGSEKAYLDAMAANKKWFVANDCVFISVMYSPSVQGERQWMVCSFSVHLPPPAEWRFRNKCLLGIDEEGQKLYEWYALSGSQFKYFPKVGSRLNGTELFSLPKPTLESLRAKADRLFD
jgi:hypothetical protein